MGFLGIVWCNLNLLLLGVSAVVATDVNPYTSGCLHNSLPGWTKKRVCNSDDPIDAAASGLCREPEITQLEIRIMVFNWDTTYFEAWLLQIILSELLDVPVTIESGNHDVLVSLYDPEAAFKFGDTSDSITTSAFQNAAKYGQDCTLASRDSVTYEPCAHHFPEIWNAHQEWLQNGISDNTLEFPYALGMVGYDGIYVTKYTTEQEPSIISYFGMAGEDNRKKLAELFPRPFSWGEYCQDVSRNNCSTPDVTAQRAPISEEEGQHFFKEGEFRGHFQHTEENNCDDNPLTCTGHLAPYPCGWSSYAESQMYHLNIALKGGGRDPAMPNQGYHYPQLLELLKAAEATGSNLMLEWWTPTEMSEVLRGSDAELIKVAFPTPTQKCLSMRHSLNDICAPDLATRVGDPIAVCDEAGTALVQTITTGLEEVTNLQDEAVRSPAYDVLKRFLITEYKLGEIFQLMKATNTTTPRDATCQWAVENFDTFLLPLVPPSHPRTLQESSEPVWTWVGISLGLLTCGVVLLTAIRVYHLRNRQVVIYAQIDFLWILLVGGLMLATGAIVLALPPTDASCVASDWLVNTGYTLILVPLIIKVAAINKLNQAAKQMKRVTIDRYFLWGATATISGTIVIFLAIWTGLDAAAKTAQYELTEATTATSSYDNNAEEIMEQLTSSTVVGTSYYCSSKSAAWRYISLGWNAFLLVCCTVLAVQTRKVHQDFRESTVLGLLIYSHSIMALLVLMTYFLSAVTKASTMAKVRSILYSLDTLTTIIIYFVPKLFADLPVFKKSLGTITSHISNAQLSLEQFSQRRDEKIRWKTKEDRELIERVVSVSGVTEESKDELFQLLSDLEQLRTENAALKQGGKAD